MADDGGGPLPPGWDRKYDLRTGRYYYINYFNKTTTWEDPRSRYRQLNQVTPQHVPAPTMVENIPLQPPRGVRSYPAFSPHPVVRQSLINSDLQQHRHTVVQFQDMRPSPIPGRVSANMTPARGTPFSSPVRSTNSIMDSSLTTDPDVAVAKIGAMFPTVSDTHIRTLLMKYHNREAVVVSALQVEKHPLSTPGPYATPPAPARRPGHMLWEAGSPRSGSPAPRPPHSSPKMKLRYLKSVFPKVEETLLLDILSNSENNVMKATEKLQGMGFEKRDTPPPRLTLRAKSEEGTSNQRASTHPTPPPRMKSVEEKSKMKIRIQDHYKDVPERVVGIALESVDYDEDRALQILQFMVQEEQRSQASSSQAKSSDSRQDSSSVTETESKLSTEISVSRSTPRKSVSPARKVAPESSPAHKPLAQKISPVSASSHYKRPKNKKEVPKMSRGTCTAEDAEYRSPFLTKATGPNPDLHLGANDELLLADYVTWSGPNPDLLLTPSPRSSLAKGPDPSLLGERTYKPRGPNMDLRKGPLRGLAKGSIYSRLTASAASQVSGESRGK